MNDPKPSPADVAPALALWIQLATRISTQPLHYRSGEEEAAAQSIHCLFQKVRDLLEQHPDAAAFRQLSLDLLNRTLRAYTARWHGWMTEDKERKDPDGKPVLKFRDEQVRRLFRQELERLRSELVEMRAKLAGMAGIADAENDGGGTTADLGGTLSAGIQHQVEFKTGEAGDTTLVIPEEINGVEREAILRRRITLENGHPQDSPRSLDELDATLMKWPNPAERAKQLKVTDAIGLALSGGGIRSATFCLGIVQVLVRKGLLPQFDYLSTVSGGGYFGSFLSCALGTRSSGDTGTTTKESAEQRIQDVFQRQEEASRRKGVESGLLRHLRNNSRYLLSGGFFGRTKIAGLLISGVLWNLLIMLPIPLFAALLAHCIGPWLWGAAILPGNSPIPSLTESPSGQAFKWLSLVFGAVWIALPGVQLIAHGEDPQSKKALFRALWEKLTVGLGLLTAAAGVILLIPALFHGHEWLRTTLAAASFGKLKGLAELFPASLTGLAGAVLAVLAGWLAPKWARLRGLAVKLFILSGPLFLLLVFLLVGNRLGLARKDVGSTPSELWNPLVLTWIVIGLTAWDWFCININTLAPHRFYRNRLCECYLIRRILSADGGTNRVQRALAEEPVQGKTELLKQVRLSKLGTDPTAPYHLINMTINAPTSGNQELRGRGGDFFLASRHFYGSPLTGYARTEELEKADPHFDLGTAMAVSGAAASTSMGWKSLPHFRFLMTLFNVRLGYWIRNPGRKAWPYFAEGAGPWYLFREMLGWMTEKCRYVNLSDGGHIENLATYELLRRRCKFIVCVDGGQEPGMECSDLIRLQRYAEIDLGIRMSVDISDLQLASDGLSRAHAILVKIDYDPIAAPGRELGWMLYIKLALSGVEPLYVKDYRRENGDFPHQTTGDQIYDEAQFEAYRALGECAMEEMFREEIVGSQPPKTIRDWFQALASKLLPDNDSVQRCKGSSAGSSSEKTSGVQ